MEEVKKLLIVQPFASGHHMSLYVRMAVYMGRKLNFNVGLLTYESSLAHDAFKSIVKEFGDSLRIHVMADPPPSGTRGKLGIISNQVTNYKSIRRSFRTLEASAYDFVWVANLEQIDMPLAFIGSPFGRAKVYGIHMTVDFHRPLLGMSRTVRHAVVKGMVFGMLFRRRWIERVALIDESFFDEENVFRRWFVPESKLEYVPDVGLLREDDADRHCLRTELGVPNGAFVVLVYGGITARKKVGALVAALADKRLNHCALVLAGKIDESARAELTSNKAQRLKSEKRLFEINRFIDLDLEARLFRSADLVSVLYSRDFSGSSGVLYQAAAAGKPFICDQSGVIGWVCKRSGAGVMVDGDNLDDIVRAVCELSANAGLYQSVAMRAKDLALKHSEDSHVSALTRVIRGR